MVASLQLGGEDWLVLCDANVELRELRLLFLKEWACFLTTSHVMVSRFVTFK